MLTTNLKTIISEKVHVMYTTNGVLGDNTGIIIITKYQNSWHKIITINLSLILYTDNKKRIGDIIYMYIYIYIHYKKMALVIPHFTNTKNC